MRGLTLHQPWASLMAHPMPKYRKRIETRGKRITYRGWLAIHAAKEIPDYVYYEFSENPKMREALRALGVNSYGDITTKLPRSSIVCVVRLVACVSTQPGIRLLESVIPQPGTFEYAFGNYEAGRYGWVTRDCHVLTKPVPASGNQTLWKVPESVVEEIEQRMPPAAFPGGVYVVRDS